ncbi:MAG: hypothetical protein N2D54_06620 [Chloroflexota bacterium]
MKILFGADGRSPTALNWLSYFIDRGDEVHLVSTYPAEPTLKFASLNILPVAFSRVAGSHTLSSRDKRRGLIKSLSSPALRTKMRQWLGPLTLPKAAKELNVLLTENHPELVHALRIP